MIYWRKAHNRRWRYEAMRALLLLASFWVLPLGAEAQTCPSFRTCGEAMRSFLNGNTRLDGDGDGVPCESLCGGGGEFGSKNGLGSRGSGESGSGSGSAGQEPPASTSQGCRILSSHDARRVAKGERVDLSGNGCQIIFNP
jgi:hypothetical protein